MLTLGYTYLSTLTICNHLARETGPRSYVSGPKGVRALKDIAQGHAAQVGELGISSSGIWLLE